MSDILHFPGEGNASPYFPPLYGKPDCAYCEKKECWSRVKYQRDRQDFTYTSGRCPRLPDLRGFVDEAEQELYQQTFPLIHAKREGGNLTMSLSIPGVKRLKNVYRSQTFKCWWFRDGKFEDGYPKRHILSIDNCYSKKDVLDYLERRNTNYCIFRCVIKDDCF